MNLAALLALPPHGLAVFLLILVRSSAIFLIAPVLGNAAVPVRVKVGLAFMVALILTPLLLHRPPAIDLTNGWALTVAVLAEIALGVMIGLMAQLLFVAIQFAGQIVGLQMGFGMANLFDPMTSTSVSVVAQFYLMVGVLVFLMLDGHHWLLIALQKSFITIPLGGFTLDRRAMGVLLEASNQLFWVTLMIMAPVLGVLVLTEVAMGIVARIMPQMNIFVASFPVKVCVGVLAMAISFPLMVGYLGSLTEQTFAGIMKFLAVH